jgi:hypothetical protein
MGARVVADGPLEQEAAVDRVLAGYRRYLLLERGLSETTAACYEPRARLFLSQCEELTGLALDRLTAADVSGFLARVPAARCRVGAAVGGGRALGAALPASGGVDRRAA